MPRGKKAAEAEDIARETPEAPKPKKRDEFKPLSGLIRLIRKPFAVGAPRYHVKSVVGVNNSNGRAIKKVVQPTPIPDGAGWEEWRLQDNPGNRSVVETGFRDPHFHYLAIYPEMTDAQDRFADEVEGYIEALEAEGKKLDAVAEALKRKEEAIEAEMAPLFESGLTEAESLQIDALNQKAKEVASERFEAEKAARIARARLKSQRDLLERLR
jgi:hypothetical protein